jgi:hypothetical protein
MRAAMLLSSVLALAACNVSGHARENGDADEGPPGPKIKRNYALTGFEKIRLGGTHDVLVTVGPAASVSAEGDQKILDRLEIRVENGELRIGSKQRQGWFNSDHGGRDVTIRVTLPKLAAATIAGTGDMRIDKVEGDRFDGEISGTGDMDIASIRVGAVDFSIAGTGGITARGTAQSTNVSVAGTGDVNAAGLVSRTAKISVMGPGNVSANASESADVSVMGPGDVTMSGAGRCTIHKMGPGDVRCGG